MKVNTPVRRWRWLAAPVAAVAAVLLATTPALAGTVQIQDDANVLNATTVQNEAATLPVGVYVWTTTQDAANRSTFDTDVRNKVGPTFPVVIGVNTQAHHTSIQIGSRAGLSQSAAISAAANANTAFDGAMRGHPDYTAATVSALDSLRGALGSARNGGNGAAQSSGSQSSGGGIIILVVLLVIALLVVFGALRFARRRFGPRPTMMQGPPMGGGSYPGPGYGPGYGPEYGPQYGPGYGRSGMSAGAAGAMGAVGGGLLGYELGKMEGERDQYRDDQYDDRGGQGGDNSGGQGGDWTVGQDSDFGGGGGGDAGGGGGGGGGDW